MSFRNAPFYSFPHQISPPHQIQYEMELPFLLYIYRDWSIFHWDTFVQTFNKTFIFFVRAFSELWEENIFTISLYLFLICWMFARLGCESVFSKQKVLVCVLPSLSQLFPVSLCSHFSTFLPLTQKLFQPSNASKKK